jgi:hypothetical protein
MSNIQPVFAFGYAEARQGMSNRRSVKKLKDEEIIQKINVFL